MTPTLQERHQDYVLGPNQDSRLASVAPGATIEGVELALDDDAPFILRSRAVYCQYNDANASTQNGLQHLKTRWTGPIHDFRHQELISEAIQSAYFGQFGNPKPIYPGIGYPANGRLRIDLYNSSPTVTLTNLTFLWRGVKLFPHGAVPAYSYPATFASMAYQYQNQIPALGVTETRNYIIFKVRQDADFVIRAGQFSDVFIPGGPSAPKNVGLQLFDFNKKPYSNDFVRADAMLGCAAADNADTGTIIVPVGSGPAFAAPFGTGPGSPGIFYPEIYVPANHIMFYSVQRDDSAIATAVTQDYVLNLIGAKVFPRG